jgi:hypothetical protein
MQNQPANEFGKRRPSTIAPTAAHPVKRSRHVALLLMGSLVVGSGAFAMMPRENCEPKGGGAATPSLPQGGTECAPRSSSSGGGYRGSGGSWSRSSFFGGDSSSNRSSSGTSSESGSGQATRGGFGGFAHSLAAHFSGS